MSTIPGLKPPPCVCVFKVRRLVVSEVVRREALPDRVTCIEKWTSVADLCYRLHNFHGVLIVCMAFEDQAVYRLKRTWAKVGQQTKQTIWTLRALVSPDNDFKNLREELERY